VRQEAPGGGVPLRPEEVAPVLADEPRAKKGRGFGRTCQFPEFGDSTDEEECEDDEPQCELVNAKAAEVNARTEPVPFQA
jgi:hypothetical protein